MNSYCAFVYNSHTHTRARARARTHTHTHTHTHTYTRARARASFINNINIIQHYVLFNNETISVKNQAQYFEIY